ncbi:MAG TPA: hypothetical protein VGF55_20390 [Gemmataceae bacterium]|jgi:hypothetical protein
MFLAIVLLTVGVPTAIAAGWFIAHFPATIPAPEPPRPVVRRLPRRVEPPRQEPPAAAIPPAPAAQPGPELPPGTIHVAEAGRLAAESEAAATANPLNPDQAWVGVIVGRFTKLSFEHGVAFVYMNDLRGDAYSDRPVIANIEWPRAERPADHPDTLLRETLRGLRAGDATAVVGKIDGVHPRIWKHTIVNATAIRRYP